MKKMDDTLSKQHRKDKDSSVSKTLRAFAYVSQIGVTMAASVLVGVLLGKFLDSLFGTKPWLLLIFSLLGVGAAIKSLFDISQKK
ncbi:AtpZ/AtpI family protein [Anaerocolumna sp.]|uniref:AtpZ/AtpI family protein n=1 Tax=Anaerocolumna sp. TaxID=2041569 RepID=UPI0028A88A08|nr:AtpZ/AtpI family protein [Anaerocolumna sp.]